MNFASTLLIPTISTGEIDNPGGRFRADSHIRFYAIHAIGLSLPLDSVTRRWRFGLAAYGVTGLGVDYRSTTLDQPRFFDFGPAGKFPLAAGEYTNLTILKFTPALAYQVTPEFSLGLALHIDYALLDLKSGSSLVYNIGATRHYPRDVRFRQKNPKFPRYIWPDFLQYLCERKSKKEKQQKPKQKEKQ